MTGILTNIISYFKNLDYSIIYVIFASMTATVIHEISHGYVAYKLGDVTAKAAGRLSLNPLKHIDPFGLIALIVFKFGWAKPVPVNMMYFKNPKRGMALTALAGPVSNLLLSFVSLLFCAGLYLFRYIGICAILYNFFMILATISCGLGIFNFIPIPPLDGSKILFSFFPDSIYITVLRYERYCMILLWILLYSGVLDNVLITSRMTILNGMWYAASYPLRLYLGI